MPVAIRLQKIAKCAKKRFYFRVGVIDKRSSHDSRVIENIGTYDPSKKDGNFKIKRERYEYWKSKGASISPTVLSLVKKTNKT